MYNSCPVLYATRTSRDVHFILYFLLNYVHLGMRHVHLRTYILDSIFNSSMNISVRLVYITGHKFETLFKFIYVHLCMPYVYLGTQMLDFI